MNGRLVTILKLFLHMKPLLWISSHLFWIKLSIKRQIPDCMGSMSQIMCHCWSSLNRGELEFPSCLLLTFHLLSERFLQSWLWTGSSRLTCHSWSTEKTVSSSGSFTTIHAFKHVIETILHFGLAGNSQMRTTQMTHKMEGEWVIWLQHGPHYNFMTSQLITKDEKVFKMRGIK